MTSKLVSRVTDGDSWAFFEVAYAQRWTDGLPVVPPTESRVAAVLDYMGRDPAEVLGVVPPGKGIATMEQVAIQSTMAGCRPEHVPVVLAALECLLAPEFNLDDVQKAPHAVAPMVIVSGPVVKRLRFHSSYNVFGGGSRANAVVGRAIRLIMRNIGGARSGERDMAVLGGPHKYVSCIAEDQDANPWAPFHTNRGVPSSESAVTVFACGPHNGAFCCNYPIAMPLRLLRVLADALRSMGSLNVQQMGGEQLIALSPANAEVLARYGWTRRDAQLYLYETARHTVRDLSNVGVIAQDGDTPQHVPPPTWLDLDDPSFRVPCVDGPESIHLVICGGDSQFWCAVCHGWGRMGGYAITRAIRWPTAQGQDKL